VYNLFALARFWTLDFELFQRLMQRLKATQPEKKSYKTEDSNSLKICFVLISKCFFHGLVDVW
jgi:hypothetical protein